MLQRSALTYVNFRLSRIILSDEKKECTKRVDCKCNYKIDFFIVNVDMQKAKCDSKDSENIKTIEEGKATCRLH